MTINKFYSAKQFDELSECLTIDDLDISPDSNLLPSQTNNIKLKNPNLKISITNGSLIQNDDTGELRFKITLYDSKNKQLEIENYNEIIINGWRSLKYTSDELDAFLQRIYNSSDDKGCINWSDYINLGGSANLNIDGTLSTGFTIGLTSFLLKLAKK